MHILFAPDSFKGSLSASQFCQIAEEVFSHQLPDWRLTPLPMADGGEGTMQALVDGTGGTIHSCTVTGPLGEPVTARYAITGDGTTGLVEMAEASGLPLVPEARRNPLLTTSYGTGELIRKVLNHNGIQKIILGLGGSATNDGGAGALQALGVRLLDSNGAELVPGGGALIHLEKIDISAMESRLRKCRLHIASDVTNPLLGPHGATMTYGPQKGADQTQLTLLEDGLAHFARLSIAATGCDQREVPGAGAAGGMGFGFLSYYQATIESGFGLVAKLYRLEERLAKQDIDLIVTGEGEVNFQSIQGKLVGEMVTLGKKYRVPVIVLCGSISGDISTLYQAGIISISSIASGPMNLASAMEQTEHLLRTRLVDLAHILGWAKGSAHITTENNKT